MQGVFREDDKVVCKLSFRYGEDVKHKNFYGENPQTDTDFTLYIQEVLVSKVFDVVSVKKIAEKFLGRLQQRSEIIQNIRVMIVDS